MGLEAHGYGGSELLDARARAVLGPAVEAAGGRVDAVWPTQVRYEPGRRLAVRYAADVTWADGTQRRETLGALVDRGDLPDGLAIVESRSGEQVGVWRYPHDPFLPGLPHAASPEGARRVLEGLGIHAGRVQVVPVVYRPGSRAVLRVAVGAATIYLKVLRPGAVEPLRRSHELVGAHARVPRCLGWSDPLGLVALEALPGRTLARPLVDGTGALPAPADVLGAAARIAAAPIDRPPVPIGDVLTTHVRLLRAVLPEAAGRAEAVAERATAATGPADRSIHGDFYEAQVLVDDDGTITGLLDIDGARRGAAHEDPSRLVAHLAALAHVHPTAATRIHAYLREVLACLDGAFPPELIRRAAAGVLLGLATTPFRRQEPHWPTRTRAWLDLAASWASSRTGVAA